MAMKSVREKLEGVWIARLRRLNCFDQIVKRLVAGMSVMGVAKWLVELNPEGELHGLGLHGWRKYLTPLHMRIKAGRPVEVLDGVVVRELLRQAEVLAPDEDPVDPAARKLWKEVEKAARELRAETMLKYCFVVQQRRVNMMVEMEQKLRMLVPSGERNLEVLREIAADVRKFEVGEQWMRGRATPFPGPYPGGSVPQPAPEELDPLAQEAAKFDEVDRNIMQEIVSKMIDMCEETKVSGRTAVGGLAPDAGGKVGVQAESVS
ncbi:MAG: hypothetical protein WBC04_19750 [Candidatus Acidiferrales bacterium]